MCSAILLPQFQPLQAVTTGSSADLCGACLPMLRAMLAQALKCTRRRGMPCLRCQRLSAARTSSSAAPSPSNPQSASNPLYSLLRFFTVAPSFIALGQFFARWMWIFVKPKITAWNITQRTHGLLFSQTLQNYVYHLQSNSLVDPALDFFLAGHEMHLALKPK